MSTSWWGLSLFIFRTYGYPKHIVSKFNPLTAGAVHILFFTFFYWHITYQLLSLFKIKSDINQQGLKIVDLHFVKSE